MVNLSEFFFKGNNVNNSRESIEVPAENTSYFPYTKQRQDQRFIIQNITNYDNNRLMINASTGSGKTVASLTGLLKRRSSSQKIIIFVKTINQMNPFLREWGKIQQYLNNHSDREITILPLLGRRHLCGLDHKITKKTIISCGKRNRGKHSDEKMEKLKKSNRRYRLIKWINRKLIEAPNLSNFIELLKTRENCPYENLISILDQSDIIILTYGYLTNYRMDYLYDLIDCNSSNCLFICDEAHNLSFIQPKRIYKTSISIFQKLFKRTRFLENLKQEIRGIRILDLEQEFSKDQLRNGMNNLRKDIHKARRFLRKYNKKSKNYLPDFLFENNLIYEVLNELEYLAENYKLGTIITSPSTISINQINPSSILAQIKSAPFQIYQSATLYPLNLFRKLYDLSEETKLLNLTTFDICKIRGRTNEFRAYYSGPLISKSKYRNDELYSRYAKAVTKLSKPIPGHVLVLCPSYEFSAKIYEILSNTPFGRKLVVESPTSRPKTLIRDIVHSKDPILIIGNQRGKILEGNEWKSPSTNQSLVNLVIFTGLSSQIPRKEQELVDRLRTKILHDDKEARMLSNEIPLYIRSSQAFGRTIRKTDEKGALIILDQRAEDFLRETLWLHRYNKLSDLENDLKQHFSDYEVVFHE